jgi:hypothetical protein
MRPLQVGDGVAGVRRGRLYGRVHRAQTPLQLKRKDQVRKLALRVGAEHGPVAVLGLQVVKIDFAEVGCA